MNRDLVMCAATLMLAAFCPKAEARPGSFQTEAQAEVDKPPPSDEALQYAIGPGDVLNVAVWKEPDLGGDVTVRFDGQISLPLVGEVKALHLTPGELGSVLERELSRFVETPRVTVAVTQVNSAQFFVLGKVAVQGAFPYAGPIRVVQALALAGGFQEFAKLDKIFVIRESERGQLQFGVNYQQLVNDRRLDFNIVILPGDTIIVP